MTKSKVFLFGCLGVIVALVLIFGLMAMSTYNRLVQLDEDVSQSWAQVENQYQRRYDLIPNLVKTVEGAADFERETLQNVIEARSRVAQAPAGGQDAGNITEDPAAFQQFAQAQQSLGGALSRLLVVVERYPELKANQNFLDLQAQLEGTENRIAVERMRYNESAQRFNTVVRRFPANLFATIFGFE
ncbi:MAG: LemA family protein, partial [Acidobacteria bacterium]|nr:LemA family protein [Acidobacteriota bacterium]